MKNLKIENENDLFLKSGYKKRMWYLIVGFIICTILLLTTNLDLIILAPIIILALTLFYIRIFNKANYFIVSDACFEVRNKLKLINNYYIFSLKEIKRIEVYNEFTEFNEERII